MMTVVRDGQVINTIPISAGGTGHTTYNGQMVIEEKDKTTRMNGATVGFTDDDGKGEYDIPDVPHAMRLSNSGTFIHGNYWTDKSVFGTANTSHGCIGLSDTKGGKDATTPAAWFYNHSLIGDVVVVTNSPDRTVQPANGLNGWNLTWPRWLAGAPFDRGRPERGAGNGAPPELRLGNTPSHERAEPYEPREPEIRGSASAASASR